MADCWPFPEQQSISKYLAKAEPFDLDAFNAEYAEKYLDIILILGSRDGKPIAVLEDRGDQVLGVLECNRVIESDRFSPKLEIQFNDALVKVKFDSSGWMFYNPSDTVSGGNCIHSTYLEIGGDFVALVLTNFFSEEERFV